MNTGSLGTHPGTSVNHYNRFLVDRLVVVVHDIWTPEYLDIHPVDFLPVGIRVRCGVWTKNCTTRWHSSVASWILQTVYSSIQVMRGTRSIYGLARMCSEVLGTVSINSGVKTYVNACSHCLFNVRVMARPRRRGARTFTGYFCGESRQH